MGSPRVVVIGGGFAGYYAARSLCRRLRGAARVIILNPTDYFLYLPLLPEVAAGVLDPRRVTVSIPGTLREVELVLGAAQEVDLDARRVSYLDADGQRAALDYDRLLITTGSVNKLLPIPGVAEHAHGFRNIAEALYLRDHVIRQIELADAALDPGERAARLTFVVVGAGYTGTEVAAQGVLMTTALTAKHPRLAGHRPRWLLIDTADRVLPGLGAKLARTADRVLRRRGVEVRTATSVAEATADGVRLSDGNHVPTRSLIWCVGVRPEPLAESLGQELIEGRLVVDEHLTVPGHPHVWACGDVAAVPDLTRPGQITAMTAQHAQRQGKRAAGNIAATFGHGTARPYAHHDLGFVVDLGGWQAAADPLHVPLSGLPAKAVTRGYHLLSLPGNRVRTAADWVTEALLARQAVQLGLVHPVDVPLNTEKPPPG
ncbi:MAG TPA: NAD(P)/FAD-dependent oxidoreductase [Jatrophihabitantaceae bacterium]|jgi:NADH dehydrogenase